MGILRTNEISGLETPTPVTGSVSFDGDGDFLTLASSGDFAFSTGKFTTECFFNWTGDNSQFMIHGEASTGNFNLFLESNSINWYNGAATSTITTGITKNVWHHIAVVRESTASNDTKVYLDGNLVGSFTSNTNYSSISILIGKNQTSGGVYADGYISNLRILKGTALYTENFTPPVHELQQIGDTVLLCCNNPDSAGAEATGKTITINGNAAASTVSPGLTRDFTFGTQFQGVAKFDTQGYFVPPSGTTEQRFPNFAGAPASSARGIFAGGSNPFSTKLNIIDYITISTTGNAQEFGDLTVARGAISGCASNTHGVFSGGASPSNDNTIDYVTISSTGDAKDFGDLTAESFSGSGLSNSTRGLFGLGQVSTQDNRIDYISLSSTGNAFDFGDLAQAKDQFGSCASSTRGIFAGGLLSPSPVSLTNRIDYVTISTTGNSVEFGDLLQGAADGIRRVGGLSNNTRGIFAGGESAPTGQKDIISYITIASLGDSQDFGDLSDGASQSDNGASSSVRGVFHLTNPSNDTLHYITISTLGNSIDFGNMTNSGTLAGVSNGHGGLS